MCYVDLVAAFLRMAVAVEAVVLSPGHGPLNKISESMSPTTDTLSLDGITDDESLANVATQANSIEHLCVLWCNIPDRALCSLSKFPGFVWLKIYIGKLLKRAGWWLWQ